jgi:hypothetical protein
MRLGQQVVFSGVVRGGATRSFKVWIVPGDNIFEVGAQKAVSPASRGSSPDVRPLAVRITLR